MKKFLKYWLPALVWAGLIFYVSANKVPNASPVYWQDFAAKKTAHVFEYAVFTILFYRAFLNSGLGKKKAAIFAILLAIFYSITDELHQLFSPGRHSSLRDVIIDSVAASLTVFLVLKLLPKMPEGVRAWAEKVGLV